jgi:hypothetical protein
MNIQDIIDTTDEYEIMDDLPLSEHIEWNNAQSSKGYLNELDYESEGTDEYVGDEDLDFE